MFSPHKPKALLELHDSLLLDRLTRVARFSTMGEMAAGVAHELNQPLTAITAYARACDRYLGMAQPDFAEIREAVREIAAEGLRAGEIIRRLRQLVRSDDGEQPVANDVNILVGELGSLLQADARLHGATLRLCLAANLPRVAVNATQLQHVILNLSRNAFEAVQEMPAGTRAVEIATEFPCDGELEIRICDNGPGIAPQIADHLFTPFASTKGAGTGLGLAISRTIMQGHGGTIGTRQGTPRGTTFYLRLPVLEERDA